MMPHGFGTGLKVLLLASSVTSVVLVSQWASAFPGATTRVSVDSAGNEANGDSWASAISVDGRFVGFTSYASNLVSNDTNGFVDVFMHDRQAGITERVSVPNLIDQPALGDQADGDSVIPAVSGDGRFAAFASAATNLVLDDTNGQGDIFVHDRETGSTECVSVPNPADQLTLGDQANGDSGWLTTSANGRFVAFASAATNLVLDDTNGQDDIFVHDRQTGVTTRVSVPDLANQPTLGSESNDRADLPAISADGRFVAFASGATNLVVGEPIPCWNIFVHDRQTGATEKVSVPNLADQPALGDQADDDSVKPAVSADGRFVAFASFATNLVLADTNGQVDIFVHDRQTGATERVSVPNLADRPTLGAEGNADSFTPAGPPDISADGRLVVFFSEASNLVLNDANGFSDIFVHDRKTNTTERVSVDTSGRESNGFSFWPFISGDGQYAAFQSWASNLVTGDTNGRNDVFVHDLPSPVGGIAEYPQLEPSATLSEGDERTSRTFAIPAVAAGFVLLAVGVWYARRRCLT